MTRAEVREAALEAKEGKGLTWRQVGEAIGRSPVYAAMLDYGYGPAAADEASGLARLLALPQGAERALRKAPSREPAQPWPPTDPFVYRLRLKGMANAKALGSTRPGAFVACI